MSRTLTGTVALPTSWAAPARKAAGGHAGTLGELRLPLTSCWGSTVCCAAHTRSPMFPTSAMNATSSPPIPPSSTLRAIVSASWWATGLARFAARPVGACPWERSNKAAGTLVPCSLFTTTWAAAKRSRRAAAVRSCCACAGCPVRKRDGGQVVFGLSEQRRLSVAAGERRAGCAPLVKGDQRVPAIGLELGQAADPVRGARRHVHPRCRSQQSERLIGEPIAGQEHRGVDQRARIGWGERMRPHQRSQRGVGAALQHRLDRGLHGARITAGVRAGRVPAPARG